MHRFMAMNTTMHTAGLSHRAEKEAESWFAFTEKHLSRFRADSELSRLNRSAGNSFIASPLLYQTVELAHYYFTATEGMFDPYLGQVMEGLGYQDSFAEWASRPVKLNQHLPSTKDRNTPDLPIFNPSIQSILLRNGWRVDLGGFAKGWSAEKLSEMLQKKGVLSGAIDAGGDIKVWGSPEQIMPVAIADPFNSKNEVITLSFRESAGIATSSTLKRSWQASDGSKLHHLINPYKQRPVESDFVQVTVVGPSLTVAEVLTKCVFILGSNRALLWLQKHFPSYAVIGFHQDGSIFTGGCLDFFEMVIGEGNDRAERIR